MYVKNLTGIKGTCSFKVPPTKILINYKKYNSTVEKPGRHHLNQGLKANFIGDATNQNRTT